MQTARPTIPSNNPPIRPTSQSPAAAVYTPNQHIMMTMTPMSFHSPQTAQYYIPQVRQHVIDSRIALLLAISGPCVYIRLFFNMPDDFFNANVVTCSHQAVTRFCLKTKSMVNSFRCVVPHDQSVKFWVKCCCCASTVPSQCTSICGDTSTVLGPAPRTQYLLYWTQSRGLPCTLW